MDRRRLAARGLVVPDSSGRDAVRVYLQYMPDIGGASRTERRTALRDRFDSLAGNRAGDEVELDPKSLSVSGQTIEALVPVDRFDEVASELAGDDVNVALVESFKVT